MTTAVRHCLVESMAAVEAARKTYGEVSFAWHTTSPLLLHSLGRDGQDVRSLEQGYSSDEFNALGVAVYAATEAVCALLNERCAWRDFADLRQVFGQSLNAVLFATLHKGRLLDRLLREIEDDVVCVGEPQCAAVNRLAFGYGRFDTVYAALAARCAHARLSVLPCSISGEYLRGLEQNVTHRRMGRREKLLSILNNTPSSFALKVVKNLRARKLYPLRHVALNPRAQKTVYLGRECELLDEAFLGLLLRGNRVGWLPALPKVPMNCDPQPLPDEDALLRDVSATVTRTLAGVWHDGALFKACLDLVLSRMTIVLRRLRMHVPQLRSAFEGLLDGLAPRRLIASAIMTTPDERLFCCLCCERGEHLALFEHGVTQGLSRWTDHSDAFYAMQAGDIGVYHCPLSARMMVRYAPGQKTLVAGVPAVMGSPRLVAIQKRLARRWLNIRAEEHVVMYVADLDRNNVVYGPYAENDLQFLDKTESIVAGLTRTFPNSTILVKLYPTQRYVDLCDFAWLEERFPNVRLIRDMDFRFVRFVADALVVTSSQSTLGWVCGAQTDVTFMEYPWSPATFGGLRTEVPGDALGAQAVIPDTTGFMVPYDGAFISEMLSEI